MSRQRVECARCDRRFFCASAFNWLHSRPTGFYDRINKMDRIPNETGPVTILLILFIPSKTLNATFRTTVRFPRKLGSFLPSLSRYGMTEDTDQTRPST